VNHSIGDNLTYDFYIDSISYNGSFNYGGLVLRNNLSYYGNNISYNWTFAPNFTDETYGLLKNLTLVVYPNSSNLTNASLLNTTINFKLNITHANSNVSFSGHIADLGPTTHTSDITLDLSPYFTDLDYNDGYYQTSHPFYLNTGFTLTSNTSSITSSFSGFTLTLGASAAVTGLVSVTGSDGVSSAVSNSFLVTFVEPTGTASTSSGSGGGTTEVPVSLKLIMPDPVSAYKKDRIELPITLYNDGKSTLYDITLNGTVARNGSLINDVNISFSKNKFSSLATGKKENLTMYINVNTEQAGTFEITVMAKVRTPSYTDWGKMFLTVKEGENIGEKIVFTEEFIVSNPECLELREVINEAKRYMQEGNNTMALKKAQEAVDSCRDLIAQTGKSKIKQVVENKLYRYLIISTIVVFAVGISFYSYKRMTLRRKRGSFLQESIKNKKYLEY
jgi:hypothetical protein